MYQVATTKGLVDRDKLVRTFLIEEDARAVVIATEWRLLSEDGVTGGELVRRDLAVQMLRAGETAVIAGPAGGGPNDVTVGLTGEAVTATGQLG